MICKFSDPHPGFAGASIPIPVKVKKIADSLNGQEMDLQAAIAKIGAVTDGEITIYKDCLMLKLGSPGRMEHMFRVIRFVEIKVE